MPSTATFRSVPIGDVITNVSSGNIARSVVIDTVVGIDGVVTRNRGGGAQSIIVEAYRECASFIERLSYVEGLFESLGTDKGTLVVVGEGGVTSWSGCLLIEVRELESAGAYVKFQCKFVR
ncbi:MAG TPA: hypothetical protein VM223_05215 [Planctomycetota bacterium]|nr:hypothetical protein [Planctomycetota bacterium]